MTVLERSELDASPLSDLHAIANQLGLEGFRRLRKADLIDAILARSGAETANGQASSDGQAADGQGADGEAADGQAAAEEGEEERPATRRRRTRTRRTKVAAEVEEEEKGEGEGGSEPEAPPARRSTRQGRGRGRETPAGDRAGETPATGEQARSGRGRETAQRTVEGVVELLGNGSAFLRVSPPEASDEDVYISAAQVRRCELVSGDRVSGPVRTPRSSERYPSLARVDTINGASAESVAEGTRYEELAATYPCERLELDPQDPTLSAIEWLTPIGRGSRVSIVGAARAGKTETLKRLLGALAETGMQATGASHPVSTGGDGDGSSVGASSGTGGDGDEGPVGASSGADGDGDGSPMGASSGAGGDGLEVMLVLSGVRPEEIAVWREGPVAPAAALDLGASAELQAQTIEHVVDTAKRVAARGGHVVVVIDTLQHLPPHVARRILAGARKLVEGGSLTLIATAAAPLGGESTVIALDVSLTSTGRIPALNLAASGTVRPELLVGDDGAAAITRARASAVAG
ncbi:MAG TPA: Rho termination factor N-terminal domain-containing protein [Solirubrobacteraceae bacterium]|jgi:transcription termination factor Rho|nr:Rho termination factor N-terminal domain-containing protein [Solirubrobacteraceae bacterium]